jgi:hypothetical protein
MGGNLSSDLVDLNLWGEDHLVRFAAFNKLFHLDLAVVVTHLAEGGVEVIRPLEIHLHLRHLELSVVGEVVEVSHLLLLSCRRYHDR